MTRLFPLLLLVACGDPSSLTGDAANGDTLYQANCASCHASDGTGGSGPNITGEIEETGELTDIILNGEGDMPGFADSLSDQDVADIIAFLQTISTGEDDEEDDD